MYIKLLSIDWLEDGFPEVDMLKLGDYDWHDQHGLLRDDDGDSTAIGLLSECFIAHPSKPGFITSPKLQKIRKEQEENRLKKQKSGKDGAKARWNNKLDSMAQPSVRHPSANSKRIANDSSSSSSSSSSSNSNITKSNITYPLTPLKGEVIISNPDLQNWVDYRKQIKKPLKPKTIEALTKKFESDPDGMRASVDNSISNGYQGLFAPSANRNGFKPHTAATTTEHNLNYLRSVGHEPIDIADFFDRARNGQKTIELESGDGADLVPGLKVRQ